MCLYGVDLRSVNALYIKNCYILQKIRLCEIRCVQKASKTNIAKAEHRVTEDDGTLENPKVSGD